MINTEHLKAHILAYADEAMKQYIECMANNGDCFVIGSWSGKEIAARLLLATIEKMEAEV